MSLVSIIIPTVSLSSDRLRRCLASIDANTPERHVVRVFTDCERRGFASTVNRGLQTSGAADYYCVLNDDTEVSPGWLGKMLSVLDYYPGVGLVGPMSDNVSGSQQGVCADGPVSIEVSRLVGFCLLIRRSVVDKIGGFDEAFTSGMFTDDDYCLRARAAGFKCRIARDSFVHHEAGATYQEVGLDYGKAMQEGWQVFSAKWGATMTGPASYRVDLPEWSKERCYAPLSEEAAA
jgi:GT2 family glycosyltransferase